MKYIFKKRKKMDQNTALKIRRLKKTKGPNHRETKKQQKGEKIKAQGTKGRSQQKAARNTKRGGSIYIYMHIYM